MSVKTDELRTELQGVLKSARDIAAKAETDDREFTAEESADVKKFLDRATEIKNDLKKLEGDDELKKAVDALGDSVDLLPKTSSTNTSENIALPGQGKSVGEQFINSPEFKSWMEKFPNGRIPDSAKGLMSPPVSYPGGLKALITGVSDTSGGALVVNQNLGLVDPGLRRPLTVRDIITIGTTGSDSVEYVRQDAQTNAAAPTAEATDSAGTTGTKPESTFTLVKITAPVRTIAHWLAATKRALADAAQLRTLIDTFLRYGLEEEIEDQVMNGAGTGENFTGILNTTGVQAHALGADNHIVATRKARTKVKVTGKSVPTAYVFHPNDWEQIDLLTDNEQRYYFGGPIQLGQPRLWGLPVIESEAMPEGTGLVGDFRMAVLWDREQASIQVSDSHSDFFIRNLVALLAEARAAFGVFRPAAFVKITGI